MWWLLLIALGPGLTGDQSRAWIEHAKPPLRQPAEKEPRRPPETMQDSFPTPRFPAIRQPPSFKFGPGRVGPPGEAMALKEELRTATRERAEEILELLEKSKNSPGNDYTSALAEAIPLAKLPEVQATARAALVRRLTRLSAKTLQAYLQVTNAELRRATILAVGAKAEKTLFPALLPLLEDKEKSVAEAALQSLRQLSGQDFGTDARKWWQWWESQKK